MNTNYFIFGAGGMLGNYMAKYHGQNPNINVIPLTREYFDLSNFSTYGEIKNYIESFEGPRYIINCAGSIRPNVYTQDPKVSFMVNTVFPNFLAEYVDAKLIHITTDCVYSGDMGEYTEYSVPDSLDIYGVSKHLGEPKNAVVIRTSIIGEELSNQRSLIEWAKSKQGQTIDGYMNHRWNGVTCLQLAKIVEWVINGNLPNDVYHFHSPEQVSKYELLRMISEVYDLDLTIVPKYADEWVDRTIIGFKAWVLNCKIPELKEQIIEQKAFLV